MNAARATARVRLTRVYRFNAGHRLFDPRRDDAWNLEVFGKCSYPGGHGHNYTLSLTVEGRTCPHTGWIVDIGALDALVERELMERFDHRNLNDVLALEVGPAPTTEVFIVEIWSRLAPHVPSLGRDVARLGETPERFDTELRLEHLELSETAKNCFEYRGPVAAGHEPSSANP